MVITIFYKPLIVSRGQEKDKVDNLLKSLHIEQ